MVEDTTTTEDDATGFMVDLGYVWMMNKNLGVGPTLTYMTTTAKTRTIKDNASGLEGEAKGTYVNSSLSPMLSFSLSF